VVGKTSMVTVARARYSVPVTHVGRMLRSECFVERIEIVNGPTRVAVDQRSYKRGATVLDLAHYLPRQRKTRYPSLRR
jgi:hypothetical protein